MPQTTPMMVFFDLVDSPELPLELSPPFKLGALVDDGEAELDAGATVSDVTTEDSVCEPLTVTMVVVTGLVVELGCSDVTVLRVVDVAGASDVEDGMELLPGVVDGMFEVEVGVVEIGVVEDGVGEFEVGEFDVDVDVVVGTSDVEVDVGIEEVSESLEEVDGTLEEEPEGDVLDCRFCRTTGSSDAATAATYAMRRKSIAPLEKRCIMTVVVLGDFGWLVMGGFLG